MDDYKRLIISDLHIGTVFSKETKIKELLFEQDFDELILAGDIIDFIKIPSFTEESASIFDFLVTQKKKIIYIVGNHDIAFKKFIGKTVGGVRFLREYDFEYCGRKFRIEHGDKYEKGIVQNEFAMNIISTFVNIFEVTFKLDLTAWWEQKRNKKRKLIRIWDIIKWNDDADVFIMGHTHKPEVLIWVDKNENIKTYVNTGDWVQNETYVTIKNGEVRLRNYKKINTKYV